MQGQSQFLFLNDSFFDTKIIKTFPLQHKTLIFHFTAVSNQDLIWNTPFTFVFPFFATTSIGADVRFALF